MLDKVSELNSRRAQINTELQTLSVPLQPLPQFSDEQLVEASQKLLNTLATASPETIRPILQHFIAEIRAERKEKEIVGSVTYYYPPPFDIAPMAEMLPIGSASMGAQTAN